MNWTDGIDKLGLSLYLMLCIFAVMNIYSVSPALGTKQGIFLGVSILMGIIIFFS